MIYIYITTKSDQRHMRKSTSEWTVLVSHKDELEQLIPFKLLREYNPLEVTEISTPKGIVEEAAFCWWIPYTLRRRDRIISTVNK